MATILGRRLSEAWLLTSKYIIMSAYLMTAYTVCNREGTLYYCVCL